jgi:hypothetical protein
MNRYMHGCTPVPVIAQPRQPGREALAGRGDRRAIWPLTTGFPGPPAGPAHRHAGRHRRGVADIIGQPDQASPLSGLPSYAGPAVYPARPG